MSRGNHVLRIRYIGDVNSEIQLFIRIHYPVGTWIVYLLALFIFIGLGLVYYKRKNNAFVEAAAVIEDEPEIVDTVKSAEEKYKTNKIDPEECNRLAEKLMVLMQEQKPYTNPDLKIAELAAMMGTSAHTLSYLFNQHLNRKDRKSVV